MPVSAKRAELDTLLTAIDEGFERKAWHGPNLRGAIRGLDPAVACRRPAQGRHTIWELVVHAAYWKYVVRRRLVGDKRGSFSIKGSNWFSRPGEPNPAAWQQDVALLVDEHRRLMAVARAVDPRRLHEATAGRRVTPAILLRGIAFHDVYHAGQIQLLKRL
jgi:DinB superfamily